MFLFSLIIIILSINSICYLFFHLLYHFKFYLFIFSFYILFYFIYYDFFHVSKLLIIIILYNFTFKEGRRIRFMLIVYRFWRHIIKFYIWTSRSFLTTLCSIILLIKMRLIIKPAYVLFCMKVMRM